MLKLSNNCQVCRAIKDNKKLSKDIFATSYYIPGAPRTLKDLYQDNHETFSYDSLKNHVKRHQFMTKTDYNNRSLQTIKKKKQELKRLKQQENRTNKDIWDTVINKGIEQIEDGDVLIKPADLLKAVKDKSDYELKVKDQQMAYAEMMWHFASGESNESKNYDRRIIEGQTTDYYDPTQRITENRGGGEEGPSNLHNPLTWDAITPGPDSLPERDNTTQN